MSTAPARNCVCTVATAQNSDSLNFGNTQHVYHLYTDNQAAEHLATQPNMNDHSRSIDIKHHGIKQDYLQDNMRIGGVASLDNTSDILTKNLQPPLHAKHCSQLHILTPVVTNHTNLLTNNVASVKSKNKRAKPHHVHPQTKATKPTPSVSLTDTCTKSNRTAKRERQKTRQQHWNSIIAARTVCRHLGLKHNIFPQDPPTTHTTRNLHPNKPRSEFARQQLRNQRSHLPTRKKTTTMKLQKLPRATLGNSVECPKSSFYYHQSRNNEVHKSPIYSSNQKCPSNANSHQYQSANRKFCKCTKHSKFLHNRNTNDMGKYSENAISSECNLSLINRIPAHKIIFDFPVAVLLTLLALYKVLIFRLSYLWQEMARTKTKLRDRIRYVHGTTITTTFVPKTNILTLRNLEKKILRNLGIIQQFNLHNANGPSSSIQALFQRQKYQSIRENCDITKRTIDHAISLSDQQSTTAHAYRGIFKTLRTMLLNEITRADMIQDRALTYWYEMHVPEPPPFPKPATQIPPETLAHRLGLSSDDEASSTTTDSTTDSPVYSPTSYSSE